MSIEPDPSRQSAVTAGEALLEVLRSHIEVVAGGTGTDEDAEELDRRLWEAVGDYGDALDELYDEPELPDDESGPEELTFTVRTRYDYTVVDEKAFLSSDGGIGSAVGALLERFGKPIGALEIDSLDTGSGLITVHLNDEPLTTSDFDNAEEPTDLLHIAPNEKLSFVLDQPVYDSRAEAEAAAARE